MQPHNKSDSTYKSDRINKSKVDRQLIVTQYQNSRKRHTSPLMIQKPYIFITKSFDFYAHARNVHLVYTDRIQPLIFSFTPVESNQFWQNLTQVEIKTLWFFFFFFSTNQYICEEKSLEIESITMVLPCIIFCSLHNIQF